MLAEGYKSFLVFLKTEAFEKMLLLRISFALIVEWTNGLSGFLVDNLWGQ